MDESQLIEMKKDIEVLKNFMNTLLKAMPKESREILETMTKNQGKTARENAEDLEPDTKDINKMSIERLKQRLQSHRQNERETFTKKEAEEFKKTEQKILKALQKAIKENRTKNVSNK